MKIIVAQFILLALAAGTTISITAYASEVKAPQIVMPKVNTGGKITGANPAHITVREPTSGVAEYRAGGDPVDTRKVGSRMYNGVTIKRGSVSNTKLQQWQQGVSGSSGGSVHGGDAVAEPLGSMRR